MPTWKASTGGERPEGRARRLKDAEALEITLRYFSQHERLPLHLVGNTGPTDWAASEGEGALKEKARDATRAWRALRQAFVRNLVTVVERPRPLLDETLAYRLREVYPSLLGVQVVDVSDIAAKDGKRYDDRVHEELGYAAAKWIAQGSVFQDNSIIGVGSGRGVFHTLHALRDFPPLGARDVRVMSLTGWVHHKNHTGASGRGMDADAHAAMMACCFSNTVTLDPLSHPIAHEDASSLERVLRRTFLAGNAWSDRRPRYALLGVGILHQGHHYDELTRSGPIAEALSEVIELCDEAQKELSDASYYPVAEIANQLFCVSSRQWVELSEPVRNRLQVLSNEINSRLLTITAEQRRDIENVILVAGTEEKALALRHLLTTGNGNVRFLTTDHKAARKLLDRAFD